jgi:hypothetical protein
MKKQNKKESKKFKEFISKFFHSTKPILVILIILVSILLIFCYKLMHNNKTYMFNGSSEYVTILNGVINLNDNLSLFEGSDLTYVNKNDVTITKYNIGYYVKINNKYVKLIASSKEDEDGLSLKGLINQMLNFNITEPINNDVYFTKKIRNNIKDNLYFIIECTTKDNKSFKDVIKIDVTDLSK